MRRANRNRLSPWIEKLIQSYGSEEGSSGRVRLKAHVIGVGQLSQSQAQNFEGPTALLFLSDGVVQIPAVLTSAAWEDLQENGDMECFTSLLNSTVGMRNYHLQFHMAMENTRCRFFLSVGKMVIDGTGPAKDKTPCCTTLPSVQQKIYETWRSLMVQDVQESQNSQIGFDLTELLGEWQHDCLQTVLEDVKNRLMLVNSVSQQPSTSTGIPSLTQSGMFTATSWDTERVQDKGIECFSIPTKYLLIPEGDAPLGRKANVARLTPDGDGELDLQLGDPTQSFVDAADRQTDTHAGGEGENRSVFAENIMHVDSVSVDMTGKDIIPLEDPWHIFPAPCGSSASCDESPEATQIQFVPPQQQKCPVNTTSTHVPIKAQPDVNTSQHSKGEHSSLPPYQKLPPASGNSNNTQTQHIHSASQEKQTLMENLDTQQEMVERQCRKSKRKLEHEPLQNTQNKVTLEEEEEAHRSGSPPSWLFDSMTASGVDDGSIQVQTILAEKRKTPAVHSDGRRFSYTYTVSGQNLLDFSQFKVEDSLLHWAVKYLVAPKQATHL
ncbi:adrenocortical dysplasia protein homolog [Dunckerocampus dactyliophorus]|uniref:adrenocortical dysplasia protein homolog n=1 Tax=Dunckerocampus dactyliophorus TaxID=161453 RepID=UPI0024051EBA|nr:adrenocortical dysplasia protein homolog [Dunckerocampus dactyliophorus]XP_054633134.1 adrenocortical dysplasia protein homolog [Dunckerocampus dactyliophorus]